MKLLPEVSMPLAVYMLQALGAEIIGMDLILQYLEMPLLLLQAMKALPLVVEKIEMGQILQYPETQT